ncbi:MAG: biotin transporter BioY [Geminicoccaceae bacterium]|nr:biotin transporter BioY [Geminicoccaceae bacterium]
MLIRSPLAASKGLALWQAVVLAVLGTAVLALSSKVQVPLYPVPITFQTAVVLLIGFAYGSRLAVATILLFLGEALLGLPVLALPIAGPAVVFGPTGGYLAGWIAAAFLCGLAADRGMRGWRLFAVTLAASAAIYLPGVLWLSGFVGGFGKAIAVGVVPFLLGDLLKSALAAAAAELGLARLGTLNRP